MLEEQHFTGTPFPTFLGSPLIKLDQVVPGSFVISGAPFDTTNLGRFGTRFGPNGIRAGSQLLAERLRTAGPAGLFDVDLEERISLPQGKVFDVGDFTIYPTDVMQTTESIASGVCEVVKRGGWSILLGGDHYISYPSVLGFTRAVAGKNPNIRVGYIHLDGHLDFADESPLLGRYYNGSHALRASELPVMVPSSMAWIGVVGWLWKAQIEAAEQKGGLVFTAEDVHSLGTDEVARRAADHASRGTDVIYVTLDIDILDPGLCPGRSAVDAIGITPTQLLEILRVFAQYPWGAMDINEVNPRLDPSGRSVSFAAEMAMTVITTVKPTVA